MVTYRVGEDVIPRKNDPVIGAGKEKSGRKEGEPDRLGYPQSGSISCWEEAEGSWVLVGLGVVSSIAT